MNLLERIELNPKVCSGKPVIKGTRIPVSVILDWIAEGEPWEKILAWVPGINKRGYPRCLALCKGLP